MPLVPFRSSVADNKHQATSNNNSDKQGTNNPTTTSATMITTALTLACRQTPPNAADIQRILTTNPHAAQARDVCNNDSTLLHTVCTRPHCSLAVVQALYKAWPAAVQMTTNRDGSLPLHVAVRYNQSLDIVQYLLQAYPTATRTADRLGNLPLHEACISKASFEIVLLLLQAYPAACERANAQERALPLHLACTVTPATFDNGMMHAVVGSLEVIWLLLETNEDACLARNWQGDTPYDLLRSYKGKQQDTTELLQLLRNKRALAQMPEHERHRYVQEQEDRKQQKQQRQRERERAKEERERDRQRQRQLQHDMKHPWTMKNSDSGSQTSATSDWSDGGSNESHRDYSLASKKNRFATHDDAASMSTVSLSSRHSSCQTIKSGDDSGSHNNKVHIRVSRKKKKQIEAEETVEI